MRGGGFLFFPHSPFSHSPSLTVSFHALHRLGLQRASAAFTRREDDGRTVKAWLGAVEGGAYTVDAGAVHVGPLAVKPDDPIGLINQPDKSATLALAASAVPYVLRKGMGVITAPEDESGVYDAAVAEYWSILEIRQTPGVIELDCRKETAGNIVAAPVVLDAGAPPVSGVFYRILDAGEPPV